MKNRQLQNSVRSNSYLIENVVKLLSFVYVNIYNNSECFSIQFSLKKMYSGY